MLINIGPVVSTSQSSMVGVEIIVKNKICFLLLQYRLNLMKKYIMVVVVGLIIYSTY
jgi:hypothetical protein